MSVRFLLGKVKINGVEAGLEDKLQFGKDVRSGKVKVRNILDWNDYIDIETY